MKILFGLLFVCMISSEVGAQNQLPVYLDESRLTEERVNDALSRMTLEEKIALCHAQSKFSSPGVSRLGIPELWTTDGPHGIRPEVLWDEWDQAGWTNDSCIAFPALTCLSATWNPEMSYFYGKSIGEEARYRKKNILLGPGVNIYRTPLNGRNFEYMGEDPYLASVMVVPYIKGVQENGVATCVKHYALNNQEFNRHTTNVHLSDRALYEIYLPAFKAAVKKVGHGRLWERIIFIKGSTHVTTNVCSKIYFGTNGGLMEWWYLTGEERMIRNRLFSMGWIWNLVLGRMVCLPEQKMRMIIIIWLILI